MLPYSDPRLQSLPRRQRRRIIRRIDGKAFRHWWVWLGHLICLIAMVVVNFVIIRSHFPSWAEVVAVGVVAGAFARLARWLQASQAAIYLWAELDSLCLSCGYDLTGNTSGVCPECGTAAAGKAGAGS
jgi:hypothetical protein